MVTKDEVQRAIDVLKKENMVHETKPPDRRAGEPVFKIPLTVQWWEIQPVVEKHPNLKEAFALLAAAGNSKNLEYVLDRVLWSWGLERGIDFYKNLPTDVLETDPPLGVYALVRNWAKQLSSQIQSLMEDTLGVPSVLQNILGKLLNVYDNPPGVVSRGGVPGRDMHRLFLGSVVFPALSDKTTRNRVWQEVVDAAHNLVAYHQKSGQPLDSANALVFAWLAYPTEFLPILHALDGVSDYPKSHTNIVERCFWDMTGRRIHFPTMPEMLWTARLLDSLFGDGMRALFESRQWDAESVRAVLRDGLQAMTDPTVYKPALKDIFTNGYEDTLKSLIESFGRMYPARVTRFLWAVARTVSSSKNTLMFMEAATQESLPKVVREWARAHIAHAYLRDSQRRETSQAMTKEHGAVAKTLCSSVFGMRHTSARFYTQEMWTDLWDGFRDLILNPSRLMENAERMRAYRHALEEDFTRRVCDEMDELAARRV